MDYEQALILFAVGAVAVVFGGWVSQQIANTLDWLTEDEGLQPLRLTENDARVMGQELMSR
jgi:hypothetical protein